MVETTTQNYYSRRVLVPYVPTPEVVVDKMLQLANVSPDDVLYDLGSGDGRIVVQALTKYGVKKAVGIEIRDDLVKIARSKINELNLGDRAQIYHGDMFEVDISEATVVTLFLLTSVNNMLRPKLEKELRSGSRVVSHEFEIPGWIPAKIEVCSDGYLKHKIYLYRR
ncbi:MAG: rRNA adenine N-6-methyltransferase family protein [Sulfolobales archaeon]